jgi:type IV secretory pathway TraG/TraD family ATPase VirD4
VSAAPNTKVILRCDEPETAKWCSALLGSHEIQRTEMTMVAGVSNFREGINLQSRRTSESIVTPAEIQRLKPLHGYLAMAGADRCPLKIASQYLQKNQPAFIPRT